MLLLLPMTENVETTCPAFRVLLLNEIKMDSCKEMGRGKKKTLLFRSEVELCRRNASVFFEKKQASRNLIQQKHYRWMPNMNVNGEFSFRIQWF